ncbi:TetR/AcrR family transcriptional regulator [Clostridium sp. MSJ-4]|uniref:TetR/AcrR family transcriptional regulator n=1 Tax=Clostridium simiarum TaxID=2841506 RepID=A0ABS6F254_9CLOT|nr:TetR/AcrR family transcriptional regulator [Clostridium simiarum]MBU5591668.1 TetR/AcrR family transcriptional regulator [Clostridium simiarum]
MKREEKNLQSRKKILDSALREFGEKSYSQASLNIICSAGNISKGIIYHYFKDKDELFLCCVKDCFDTLVSYIEKGHFDSTDFQSYMQSYLNLRYQFFRENPYYSNIFFNAVLQPPKHLTLRIKELRKDFDALNLRCCKNILNQITLRDGITEKEAIEYFSALEEMFNGYFQSKAYKGADFHALVEDHELKLPKILNIMLYGIAKEESNE